MKLANLFIALSLLAAVDAIASDLPATIHAGDIAVTVDGNHLELVAGSFSATLYPESTTRFFAIERDIRFDFETNHGVHPASLAVYDNGVVSEPALRER
ncbi:hypothetical protein FHY18_000359 [Xanthomonas arboricola]|uniref:hypothetical protein n=1 Tax=Xanthomonas sp. 3793 TaxID=3035312 RepID=UPI0021679454|nr:hypothetical protein [Xanthomonas sp. 3793]MCS3744829.1 hypothetical protein [Xanthomonas sp. 3793]